MTYNPLKNHKHYWISNGLISTRGSMELQASFLCVSHSTPERKYKGCHKIVVKNIIINEEDLHDAE